ncbi:MAG TPA: hypothetical protein VNJ08_05075 [Bacteriovoracaceae bacterium]|nr:hypothetical protein [Bacteriovoracaceae bacterium]
MRILLLLSFLFINVSRAAEISPESPKPISKIWLKSEIIPMNFGWQDMGLSREESFTLPITEAWVKWLSDNLPPTVAQAVICSAGCQPFIEEWETQPPQMVMSSTPTEYSNGVLLKVIINIWKLPGDSTEHAFRWEGRTVLLDLKTKRLMGALAIYPEDKRFIQLAQNRVNSVLGNHIYRSPLDSFMKISKVLARETKVSQMTYVKIKGHKNLMDAIEAGQLLETRGTHLGLSVGLSEFTKQEAQLLCYYQGEEKAFNDLLSQLKELKSSHSYTLVNQSTGPEHVLQLVTE